MSEPTKQQQLEALGWARIEMSRFWLRADTSILRGKVPADGLEQTKRYMDDVHRHGCVLDAMISNLCREVRNEDTEHRQHPS